MSTQIKRRYVAGMPEHATYSDFMDKYLLNSNILNSGSQPVGPFTVFWDLPNIRSALYEIAGNENGEFIRMDKVVVPALIPQTKTYLQEIEAKFEKYCDQQESMGYDRPIIWPKEYLTEKLKLEARLDVYMREAEFLRQRIEQAVKKKKEIADLNILQYGPAGAGRLRDGQLCELDGQEVKLVDKVLLVASEASPYYGMKVSDYRKFIVETWRVKLDQLVAEATSLRNKELVEKGFSKIEIPSYNSLRRRELSELPAWPEGVKNYLVQEKEVKEK